MAEQIQRMQIEERNMQIEESQRKDHCRYGFTEARRIEIEPAAIQLI